MSLLNSGSAPQQQWSSTGSSDTAGTGSGAWEEQLRQHLEAVASSASVPHGRPPGVSNPPGAPALWTLSSALNSAGGAPQVPPPPPPHVARLQQQQLAHTISLPSPSTNAVHSYPSQSLSVTPHHATQPAPPVIVGSTVPSIAGRNTHPNANPNPNPVARPRNNLAASFGPLLSCPVGEGAGPKGHVAVPANAFTPTAMATVSVQLQNLQRQLHQQQMLEQQQAQVEALLLDSDPAGHHVAAAMAAAVTNADQSTATASMFNSTGVASSGSKATTTLPSSLGTACSNASSPLGFNTSCGSTNATAAATAAERNAHAVMLAHLSAAVNNNKQCEDLLSSTGSGALLATAASDGAWVHGTSASTAAEGAVGATMNLCAEAALDGKLQSSSSLYIKNLPPEADELYLYQKFAPHGAVLSVMSKMDTTTGQCRGIGFVNFADSTSAMRAMQLLHGSRTSQGRQLHISLQAPRAVRVAVAAAQTAATSTTQAINAGLLSPRTVLGAGASAGNNVLSSGTAPSGTPSTVPSTTHATTLLNSLMHDMSLSAATANESLGDVHSVLLQAAQLTQHYDASQAYYQQQHNLVHNLYPMRPANGNQAVGPAPFYATASWRP